MREVLLLSAASRRWLQWNEFAHNYLGTSWTTSPVVETVLPMPPTKKADRLAVEEAAADALELPPAVAVRLALRDHGQCYVRPELRAPAFDDRLSDIKWS